MFFSLTINIQLQAVILYWWLHNVWMMWNQMTVIFTNVLIAFFPLFALEYYTTTRFMLWFPCVLFSTTKSKNRFFLTLHGYENWFKEFLVLVSFMYIFSDRYWTIFSKPFSSGDHVCFQYGLILLLVVTFTNIFVPFQIFSNHLFSSSTLLLVYW